MSKVDAWDELESLSRRVLKGSEALSLTDGVRHLLSECADAQGISQAEVTDGLRSVETATDLLREINKRWRSGRRLTAVGAQSMELQNSGDLAGARKVLEDYLATESDPHCREDAENMLCYLTGLEVLAKTGQIQKGLRDWHQLAVLNKRVREGQRLDLSGDMRDFLRRTAASVALSEAEAEEALASQEGAETLLARMLERIDEGRRRIFDALDVAYDLRDAGRLEEARQELRDVLSVVVIPTFRKMAEEHLEAWGTTPPG